ncbi:MAG: DUF720 domain-containing protein [Chlamydiales bacterium]|nr:DUF720 domain-containing protein [Chlamydiales bacterium]
MEEIQNNNAVEMANNQILAIQPVNNKEKKKQKLGSIDPLLLAYLEIVNSVKVGQEAARAKTKELNANVNAQQDLINQEAYLNFTTVSEADLNGLQDRLSLSHKSSTYIQNAKNQFLECKQMYNQRISAMRDFLGDKLTMLKQNNQLCDTKLNSVISEDQQCVSEGSGLMNMLRSLTQQISHV